MARMKKYRVDEVYGVTRRRVPLTYESRESVDDRFLNEMRRDQHLVIYGTSKQGKSSLLKVALEEGDYVEVQCGTSWTKETLYGTFLKNLTSKYSSRELPLEAMGKN